MNTYLNTTIPMNSCLATWQQQLEKLESEKKWDEAIAFMEEVIQKKPSKDAYINMNYLMMNLLTEENYNEAKHDYYAQITKKYYDESYALFKSDPEYLFYTGMMSFMSPWYFGIDLPDAQEMIDKAMKLEPDNILYKRTYYFDLDLSDPTKRAEATPYAKLVLENDSPIKKELYKMGMVGKYIYRLTKYWAEKVLGIRLY